MEPVVERTTLGTPTRGAVELWASNASLTFAQVVQQFGYRLNRVAPLDGSEPFTHLIAGDPGFEETGITVGGTLYESSAKISDLGGTNIAQLIMHRHSTTWAPIIVGSRTNTDTASHSGGIVTNNMPLFDFYAVGYDGTDYAIAGRISFQVDGTPGSNDMPGRIVFYTTPDGSQTPVEAMRINQDQTVTFAATPSYARLRLTATDDLSIGSTLHAFQIGPDSGGNLAMDQNEIMARNNGSLSPLYIQNEGGELYVNFSGSASYGIFVGRGGKARFYDPSNAAYVDLYTDASSSRLESSSAILDMQNTNMRWSRKGTTGWMQSNAGNASNPAYFAWYTADDVRRAYIGWNSSNRIMLQSENSWGWWIGSAAGIALNAATGNSIDLYYNSTSRFYVADRTVVYDNGATSPLFRIVADDAAPWAISLYRSDLGTESKAYFSGSGWYFEHVLYRAGSTVWDSGNDGSGSGLDADLLDGYHGTATYQTNSYFFKRYQSKTNSGALSTSTWYTIFQHPVGLNITSAPPGSGGHRSSIELRINDGTSGRHTNMRLQIEFNYGTVPAVHFLAGSYSTPSYKIRLVWNTVYDGWAIQLQPQAAISAGSVVLSLDQGLYNSDNTLVDFTAQTPHGSWSNLVEIDPATYGGGFFNDSGPAGWGRTNTSFYPVPGDTNGAFRALTGTYGSVEVTGAHSSWSGYGINGGLVFMQNNGSTTTNRGGLYDDYNNQWVWQYNVSGSAHELAFYFAGSARVETIADGIKRSGEGSYIHHASSSYAAGGVTLQSGGSPSGGSNGDIVLIY